MNDEPNEDTKQSCAKSQFRNLRKNRKPQEKDHYAMVGIYCESNVTSMTFYKNQEGIWNDGYTTYRSFAKVIEMMNANLLLPVFLLYKKAQNSSPPMMQKMTSLRSEEIKESDNSEVSLYSKMSILYYIINELIDWSDDRLPLSYNFTHL